MSSHGLISEDIPSWAYTISSVIIIVARLIGQSTQSPGYRISGAGQGARQTCGAPKNYRST